MHAMTHRITRLVGPDDVVGLIATANRARSSKASVDVRLTPQGIFPNAAVPMAAALDYYRRTQQPIRVIAENDDAARMRVARPLHPTSQSLSDGCLSRVWEYRDEEEAMRLCRAFVSALSDHAVCEEGVVESVNWCLYEVMDNVFQHSRAGSGFAMMQVHVKKRWAAVSFADSGIGIHRSFVEGGVHPAKDAYEAIMLAVQERITSKPKNMGNGLYGLMRVVGLNRGVLEIRSGRGRLRYEDRRATGDASRSRPLLETSDHHGTTVDWQVDLARPVSIIEALGMDKDRANLRLEALEDSEGVHRVLVSEFEEGLGTRRSAESVRNRLLNILNEGAPVLRLDFTGVTVVSSSFADEVLGKLALRMGLIQFMRRFELDGMTPTVDAIVERAIQQRLAEGDDSTPGTSTAAWTQP